MVGMNGPQTSWEWLEAKVEAKVEAAAGVR